MKTTYITNLGHKCVFGFVALTGGFFMAALALRDCVEQESTLGACLCDFFYAPLRGIFNCALRLSEGLLGMRDEIISGGI